MGRPKSLHVRRITEKGVQVNEKLGSGSV